MEVVNEVVAEAKAVEVAVEKAVEKVLQELSTEEQLFIRNVENEYLKASMELQRLQQVTQNCQKQFQAKVEELTKKYALSPLEWVFDTVALSFKKK